MNTPNQAPQEPGFQTQAEGAELPRHKRESVPILEMDDDGVEPVWERQESLQNMWHKNSANP